MQAERGCREDRSVLDGRLRRRQNGGMMREMMIVTQ
jgi:hypothetical protein